MEPARGIDNHYINAAGLGRLERVEDDRAGVGAVAVRDDFGVRPSGPDFKLLDAGGAEGVPRGEHNALALP